MLPPMRRDPSGALRLPKSAKPLDLPLGAPRAKHSRATTLASAALLGLACFAVALSLAGCSESQTTELRDVGVTPVDAGPADASTIIDASITTDASTIIDSGVACDGLDERSCSVAPGCVQHYCPTCNGRRFQLCGVEGGPIPDCARPQCECTDLDQATCEASPACHGVYFDSGACACPTPGCCATFVRCAEGPADCAGLDLACRAQAPLCQGPYVISHVDTCYEGCALLERCDPAPIDCTAPVPSFPELSRACNTTDDCAFGLRQIDCCGSNRAVGIATSEIDRFARGASICSSQFPECDCIPRGTETEDGELATREDHIVVECVQGACTTRTQR